MRQAQTEKRAAIFSRSIHRAGVLRRLVCLATLLGFGLCAQEPGEARAPAPAATDILSLPFRDIAVGDFTVSNGGAFMSLGRKMNQPPDMWETYMHGVIDHFAAPIAWSELLGESQDAEAWLDPEAEIDTFYKRSNLPAMRLTGETAVALKEQLPIDLAQFAGESIRLFVWMKGEETGDPDDCWGSPPGMNVIMKDVLGNRVGEAACLFKTQGTFPWHCYYSDVALPANGEVAALQVELVNHAGTAWFSTLSWEAVTPLNTYTASDKQDPVFGSVACNSAYDELPYHMRWGKGEWYVWNFLAGGRAGLRTLPFDLTTKAGFRDYYHTKAKTDLQHMCFAVALMADWYHFGARFNLLPALEDGWLEGLAEVILEDQDAETGFWGYRHAPLSMAVTRHFVEGLFGAARVARADREDVPVPWLSVGAAEIPRAESIIETVLSMQSSASGSGSGRIGAGWPEDAFHFAREGDGGRQKCSLAATGNAIYLIRAASRSAGGSLRARVAGSVKDALRYVLETCVLDDGLWKLSDTAPSPSAGAFLQRIINDSSYLERRFALDLPAPRISVPPVEDGKCTFTWDQPGEECVSVRIYAVPRGTPAADVNQSFLVGIIQRTGTRIVEMDPFEAVRKMRQAAAVKWGLKWPTPAQPYVQWKLGMFPDPLPVSSNAESLTVTIADIAERDVHAASTNWYGEESRLAPVAVSVKAAAGPGPPAAPGEGAPAGPPGPPPVAGADVPAEEAEPED